MNINLLLNRFILLLFIIFKGKNISFVPSLLYFRNSNVIIIASSGIGDALMALPLLLELHKFMPEASIDIVVNKNTYYIFRKINFINRLYFLESTQNFLNRIMLIIQLRKRKYKLSISAIPANTRRQMLLPFLAGVQYRIKHEKSFIEKKYKDFNYLYHNKVPIPIGRHRVDSNLDLLRVLGIEPDYVEARLNYEIPINSFRKSGKMLSRYCEHPNENFIGFHPGCFGVAYGEKRWPWKCFVELGDKLQSYCFCRILLFGGKEEIELADRISNRMKKRPIMFTGKTSLDETAALIKRCQLFICNDSGLMHLAEAIQTPLVAIFGPTDERQIGPYKGIFKVLRNGRLTENISVNQVFGEVKKILKMKDIKH